MYAYDVGALTEFQGTDRFRLKRCLGAGAYGVVYEVFDKEKGAAVALKTLRQVDPAALYRFKREFRTLSDVSHPNLVQLHELLSEGESLFFSMELVDGLSFIEWVRGRTEGIARSDALTRATPAAVTPVSRDVKSALAQDSGRAAPPLHLGRLRHGLLQLGEGLSALHRNGILHRDIKPQNVLVTPEERVVLLDFGLATALVEEGGSQASGRHAVGTPAYMSPEQARGVAVTEASDWYSVGVMLYEALTGILPFSGLPLDILLCKQSFEPVPVEELVQGLPEDLAALCRDLLRKEPELRPAGEEVLARLRGGVLKSPPVFRTPSKTSRGQALVGREEALAALHEAFAATQDGRAATLLLTGPSGIGKTTLLRHFLREVAEKARGVVVLSGRCYERESVPYKALDSLVDALTQHLRRLSPLEAEALLPRDVLALARLFPVLKRVEAVAGARRRVLEIPDSQELRRRAFAALRELFQRLTDKLPLVLTIDDLQWGDADSGALLGELLRPPEAPPLLLIGSCREDGLTGNPLLQALAAVAGVEVREVALAPLGAREAEELAVRLLGEGAAPGVAKAIAAEANGNPLYIDELVRFSHAEPDLGKTRTFAGAATSLADVVRMRIAKLPEEARRLLSLVAVAGGPLPLPPLLRAAALERGQDDALPLLQAARLVRTRGGRGTEEVEAAHEQIRLSVVQGLSPEDLASLHRRLAVALEASGKADPEALALHFQAAGEPERAAEYVTAAAARAVEALAFDRAARLYRLALDAAALERRSGESRPGAPDPEQTRQLRIALGDALVNAGRGAEAAESYLLATEGARAADVLELKRRAAEQLLRSGHIDRGLDAMRDVLAAVGMRLASTPKKALASLLGRRLWIAMRGLKFTERDATQIAAEELMRIDICWSVAVGLGIVDTIRGSEYQARHLLLALAAGEPYRVARALAIETGYTATRGGHSHERTEELRRVTAGLAQRIGHPHAIGLSTFISGLAAYLEGRWRACHELCEEADGILKERCTGVAWELGNSHFYSLRSLFHLGELEALSRKLSSFLTSVQERGDLYSETNLRTRVAYVPLLCAGDTAAARQQVSQMVERWSHRGFHLQHYFDLFGQTEVDLFEGDAAGAWRRVEAIWPAFTRTLFQRIQLIAIESFHLHARAALAVAGEAGSGREALLEAATRDAERIEAEKMPWGEPLARLIRAGVAAYRGKREETVQLLAAAEAGFETAGMLLWAAAARRRRGEALGGAEGQRQVEEADAWMGRQTIKSPRQMADMLAPGRFVS